VKQFIVTTDNDALFSVLPTISSSGTLSFAPADNVNVATTVHVTVMLQDNGGTANGGVDTSAPQTFTITITPVADQLFVTNTKDDSPGSLRDCMTRARRGDTIVFDANVFAVSNSDPATFIHVKSPLPWLDNAGCRVKADRQPKLQRLVYLDAHAAGATEPLVTHGEYCVRLGDVNEIGYLATPGSLLAHQPHLFVRTQRRVGDGVAGVGWIQALNTGTRSDVLSLVANLALQVAE
jgi:hypothetical protein